MLYVGLDRSHKRLDWKAIDREGERVAIGAVPPDRDGLAGLTQRLGDTPVLAVIESMNGARFVHDQLELAGWEVRIADGSRRAGSRRLPARPTRSTAGCSASSPGSGWCPRSGCPTRPSGLTGSGRVSGCTWSSTAAR